MPERLPNAERPGLAESIKDPVGVFLKRLKVEAPENAAAASAIFHSFSSDHKAEFLWEMYQDLRHAKTVSQDKSSLLAALHADAETRTAYEKGLQRHEDERKIVNGSYDQYRVLQKKIDHLEQNYDKATRVLFAQRGTRTSAFDKLAYQKINEHLDNARAGLEQMLEAHPKLAARVSYDRLTRWSKELTKDKFMWLPSRREILEQLESASLSGRPVLMVGESGTGKTSLVEAASHRLTDQLPFKAQGGPSTRLQDSLASKAIKGDTSYLEYGALGQAVTGQESNLDETPEHHGGVYFDDEFNNRPRAVQMEIIKAVSGVRPGHEARLPLVGKVDVQPNYQFIAAGNPPGERYEREAMDPAVRREFGTAITVGYPELTDKNPELYEAMLASLMDKNGRLRFAKEELSPAWDESQERVLEGGRKERHVSEDPTQGGALWRFAQAVDQLWASYSRQPTVLHALGEGQYLSEFVLDPGVIFGWLRQATEEGYTGSLEAYLNEKISAKLSEAGISKEDRDLAKEFFKHFGLLGKETGLAPEFSVMTPEEVGLLSPRVKYLKAEPVLEIVSATAMINGKAVQYLKAKPDEAVTRRDSHGLPLTLLGFTKDGSVVVQPQGLAPALIPRQEFEALPIIEAKPKKKRKGRRGESDPKLEAVREAERKRLKEFFGKDIDVPELPNGITPEKIEQWERKGFKLEYWPREDMTEDRNLPGWKHKPGKRHASGNGIEFYDELQKIQTLPENAQNPHLQGLSLTELPGTWVLKDARKKPGYKNGDQAYENDLIIQHVLKELAKNHVLNAEAVKGLRNIIHPDMFKKSEFWEAFEAALDLEDIPGAIVRLPRAIEANVMGQGTGFHDTNTWEWCEEYYRSGGRLVSGDSVLGGASGVRWLGGAGGDVGFRPLVVFSSEIGTLEPGDLELWKRKTEKLCQEEAQKLSAFFEKQIDVPPLPTEITPDRLENWEKLGFELHYFPAEDMTKDRQLKNWKKKPIDRFYEEIAKGNIPAGATRLPEGWFVIDGRQKPAYANGDQMYDHDPLSPVLEDLNRRGLISQSNYDRTKKLDAKSRFGLKPEDFEKPEVIMALAKALDLDPAQFSLSETIVWNVLANIHHPEWGTTNTSEWQTEKYGSGKRLFSGDSDGGGASDVDWGVSADGSVGFRPLARFSP